MPLARRWSLARDVDARLPGKYRNALTGRVGNEARLAGWVHRKRDTKHAIIDCAPLRHNPVR